MVAIKSDKRFDLGQVVMTAGVHGTIPHGDIMKYISRHHRCDWGDLSEHDMEMNEDALRNGHRLHSSYALSNGGSVWVITEADRSVTTVLLPDEY